MSTVRSLICSNRSLRALFKSYPNSYIFSTILRHAEPEPDIIPSESEKSISLSISPSASITSESLSSAPPKASDCSSRLCPSRSDPSASLARV